MKSGIVERYKIADGREAARYWIHDRILVGGEINDLADGTHLMKDYGITHSLSMQFEKSDNDVFPGPISNFPNPDDGKPFPIEKLHAILDWTTETLKDPNAILYVHCQIGGSRSPSIAWLILRGCFSMDPKAAQQLILNGRQDFQCVQGMWQPHSGYVDSISQAIVTWKTTAILFGTIHEDGSQVWDGTSWVSHGMPAFPAEHKAKWPKRLMKLRNQTWFPYTKLFMSTPTYAGQAFSTYMASILQLARSLSEMGVEMRLSWPRGDGIARCRNRQVSEFLDTDCTHFLAVDADIGFQPQHVMDMVTSPLDCVFGCYPAKGIEWHQLWTLIQAGAVTKAEQMETAALRFVINYRPDDIKKNQFPSIEMPDGRLFIEVAEASTGFTCIRREVIEHIVQAYPEYHYADDYPNTRYRRQYNIFNMGIDSDAPANRALNDLRKAALKMREGVGQVSELVQAANQYSEAHKKITDADGKGIGRYLSEDFGFCRLATDLGYKIYVYAQARLSHTGLYTYEGSYRDTFSTKPATVEAKEHVNGKATVESTAAQAV